MLAKYKAVFQMTDEAIQESAGPTKRLEADSKLAQFDEFLKKMLLHYKEIKKRILALMECKNDQMSYQRQIFASIGKYEERNF